MPHRFLHLVEVGLDGLHLLLEILDLRVVIVQDLENIVSEVFRCQC